MPCNGRGVSRTKSQFSNGVYKALPKEVYANAKDGTTEVALVLEQEPKEALS